MINKRRIIQYIEVLIGVILLSLAYFFFLQPSNLVTGGVMGITIIVEDYLPFSPSIFMYICNGILLIVGLILLGKEFFIKTCFASLFSPTVILILENTCDPEWFLSSVDPSNWYFVSMLVSGVLVAVGLGICFRANATTGGIDVIQKIMTKYLHIPYSKTMYFTDWIIILISGFFIKSGTIYSVEGVVYGGLSVLLTGYIVDYIALNAKPRRTAYIITSKPQELKNMIYETFKRGVTECDVRGGYTNEDKVMLICTLDKTEAYKLQDRIHAVDPNAFTFMSQTKEVLGEFE